MTKSFLCLCWHGEVSVKKKKKKLVWVLSCYSTPSECFLSERSIDYHWNLPYVYFPFPLTKILLLKITLLGHGVWSGVFYFDMQNFCIHSYTMEDEAILFMVLMDLKSIFKTETREESFFRESLLNNK